MHSTMERTREVAPTRWQRWVASPASLVAVAVAIIVGFAAWGIAVDDRSFGASALTGVGVAALYVVLTVSVRLLARRR